MEEQQQWENGRSNYDRPGKTTVQDSAVRPADGWDRTALHEAAEFGHLEAMRTILASANDSFRAAMASAPDELGWTPLHWAALHGEQEMASELLQAEAAVDAKEYEFGCQPLHWAARRGHIQLIQLLLDSGATESVDLEGRTAAVWANLTGHTRAAAFLQASEDGDLLGDESEHMYSQTSMPASHEDRQESAAVADEAYGMTALHVAAAANQITEIGRLLGTPSAGLSTQLSARDAWGRTPLLVAIQSRESGAKGALSLLQAEASQVKDNDGRGALHWAVLAGEMKLFKQLRQLSQSDATPDRWGRTLIHHAAANGHSDILAELLQDHAEMDIKDRAQQTPLHLASASGHSSSVKQLLDHKASLNVVDLLLRKPLHYASMFGHIEIMRLLVNAGGNYSDQDLDGETAARYLARTPFIR